MEEAIFLTKFAKNVHVIHRKDKLRASKIMQDRAFENNKIKFHWNSVIEEIKGSEKVDRVMIKNVSTNQQEIMSVGGLFVAIGHEPNTKLFKGQIDLDDQGYIALKSEHTN